MDSIVVDTGSDPVGTVIWMHGLGADGHDFEALVPHLHCKRPLRFIFPNAPKQPVTINGGMVMRAWYDILELSINRKVDAAGIARSRALIEALIAGEKSRGINANRIIIAGFSQGGAMALDVGLRHKEKLAGIMVLSAYLPLPDALDSLDANRTTPVLQCHGSWDMVVPTAMGEMACRSLTQSGMEVDWRTYRIPHSVGPQEVADIGAWINDLSAQW